MFLTASVQVSAPWRIPSCLNNGVEFYSTALWDYISFFASLLHFAFVSLKLTSLTSLVDFAHCVLFFFSVAAQRKGANEIPSTTECPNSAGLPQTETGMAHCDMILQMIFMSL